MEQTLITNTKVLQKTNNVNYELSWKDVFLEDGEIVLVSDKIESDNRFVVINGNNSHVLLPSFTDNHIYSRMIDYCVHHPWRDESTKPQTPEECGHILIKAYLEARNSGTSVLMDYPEYLSNPITDPDGWRMPFETMKDLGLIGVVRMLLSHDKIEQSGFLEKTIEELSSQDIDRIRLAESSFPDFKIAVWIPEESWFYEKRDISGKVLEYLRKLYEKTNKDVFFVMHCAETEDRTKKIRQLGDYYGTRYHNGVEFLERNGLLRDRTVLVHCRYDIRGEDIGAIRDSNARVVVRPSKKQYEKALALCPLTELLNQGINVGYGTDVPVVRNGLRRGFEVIPEVINAMGIYNIDFETSLSLATDLGSKVFGFERTGRIKEGYHADLVMFDTRIDLKEEERKGKPYSLNDLEKELNSRNLTRVFLRGNKYRIR